MLASGPAADDADDSSVRSARLSRSSPGRLERRPPASCVRSVFYKGLAAAVTEALRAGRAAGCEEWLRADIGQVLAECVGGNGRPA